MLEHPPNRVMWGPEVEWADKPSELLFFLKSELTVVACVQIAYYYVEALEPPTPKATEQYIMIGPDQLNGF